MKTKSELVQMWKPVLDAEGVDSLSSVQLRESTAQILENTLVSLKKATGLSEQSLLESFDNQVGTANGIKGETDGQPNNLTADAAWQNTDQRLLMAALPLARRMFTQLLAHQLVGVQPMNGPTGYATCLRHVYNSGVNTGKEMVFDTFDASFSGTSAFTGSPSFEGGNAGSPALNKWFGSAEIPGSPSAAGWKAAAGKWVQDAEGAGFTSGNLARGKMKLQKALLEAKSRAIATSYSIEDAEDLMAIQGINVNSELVAILGNEIKNEIDRELLQTIVLGAIGTKEKAAKTFSKWSPVTADGADQLKRLATLMTQIYVKSNRILYETKQGSANWMVLSSDVAGYVERMGDYTIMNPGVDVDGSNIAYCGTLKKGNIKVYKDALSDGQAGNGDSYVLLGWKGHSVTETGVVYLPYVPVQILQAPDVDVLGGQKILCRSRYAVYNNMFGTERYYQYIQIADIAAIEFGAQAGNVAGKYVFVGTPNA